MVHLLTFKRPLWQSVLSNMVAIFCNCYNMLFNFKFFCFYTYSNFVFCFFLFDFLINLLYQPLTYVPFPMKHPVEWKKLKFFLSSNPKCSGTVQYYYSVFIYFIYELQPILFKILYWCRYTYQFLLHLTFLGA